MRHRPTFSLIPEVQQCSERFGNSASAAYQIALYRRVLGMADLLGGFEGFNPLAGSNPATSALTGPNSPGPMTPQRRWKASGLNLVSFRFLIDPEQAVDAGGDLMTDGVRDVLIPRCHVLPTVRAAP
jgi:hypothetical protein